MAHDDSEGLSPDGWRRIGISTGALNRAFPPDLVDAVVDATGIREVRRRLPPARQVVYFVLALWLFRAVTAVTGEVIANLVDRLCTTCGRGRTCWPGSWTRMAESMSALAGGGGPTSISSPPRARSKLGADPLYVLFEHVAGGSGHIRRHAREMFYCGLPEWGNLCGVSTTPKPKQTSA